MRLTLQQINQLDGYKPRCRAVEMSLSEPALEQVVIRTETGDHYLAAIHREGNVLVFDLGQKVEE